MWPPHGADAMTHLHVFPHITQFWARAGPVCDYGISAGRRHRPPGVICRWHGTTCVVCGGVFSEGANPTHPEINQVERFSTHFLRFRRPHREMRAFLFHVIGKGVSNPRLGNCENLLGRFRASSGVPRYGIDRPALHQPDQSIPQALDNHQLERFGTHF